MEQEVRQTTTETTLSDGRDRAFMLARNIWRDFGPLIVGAIVLLLVLVGGWSLFRRSQPAQNPQEVVLDTQTGSEVVLPESSISLSGSPSTSTSTPSPTPSSSPKPSATPTASGSATTKGGQPKVATGEALTKGGQLPKTGPEGLILLTSAGALASGLYIFRKLK